MTKTLSDEMQRTARQALASLQPAKQGDEAGGLPLRRLLAAFFRARYLVFGTTLFGVLIGMFMAITTPNNYVSTGKFLFTTSGAESTLLASTQVKETSQETIATGAAYILNSDDLFLRVVEKLTPQRILQPYQPGGKGFSAAKELFFKIQRDWNAVDESNMTTEEALKRLQKTISVERPRFTEVLVATCNANNPELAQEILQTYMDEAIEWHIEKYESEQAYEGAKKSYEESVEDYDLAQQAMRTFLDRKAMVQQFPERLAAVQMNEIEASSRLTTLQDDLKVKTELRRQIQLQLEDPEKLPPTKTRKVRQSVATELLTELRTQLAQAHIRLSELKLQLADENALEIRAQRNKISAIEQSIADAAKAQDDEALVEERYENPQYTKAIELVDELERDVLAIQAQIKMSTTVHDEQAKELRRLLTLEPEYEKLRTAIERADQRKSSATIIWDVAQSKRALGVGKVSTLKESQRASLPLEKEGPSRGKLLIGGLFVGLFLGIGLVILRTLPDRVVRTRDDLEELDGLTVIGIMPRLDRVNLKRHMSLREQGW